MQKVSLPAALRMSLKQHALAADIPDDEDLKILVDKLDALHEKIQTIKESALAKRNDSNK